MAEVVVVNNEVAVTIELDADTEAVVVEELVMIELGTSAEEVPVSKRLAAMVELDAEA